MKQEGLIHIYCGDGKGKTTAALGLAIRFLGAGGRVLLVQFLKGSHTAELAIFSRLEGITILRNTQDFGFSFTMGDEEKQQVTRMHNQNLSAAIEACRAGKAGMLILDECLGALSTGLIDREALFSFIRQKPPELELVLTGRNPPDELVELADYVSEIRCVKHPYTRGIPARDGIEQ